MTVAQGFRRLPPAITRDGLLLNLGSDVTKDAERITHRHSHVGTKGDLTVELHYGDFDTGHGEQAALKLWARGHETRGVYVPLSDLWKYIEREAIQHLVPQLAEQLYGHVTRDDQFRVLDALLDYLEDLRKSPPPPDRFKDKTLDNFLEGCDRDGLGFFVEVNGKRVVG